MQSTLRQLREKNPIRSEEAFGIKITDWSLPDYGNALAGETGELCNIIKKIHRGDFKITDPIAIAALANEVGDIITYLDLLCQRAGINLEKALIDKYNNVSIRKGHKSRLYITI